MQSLTLQVISDIDGLKLNLSFNRILTIFKLQKEKLFSEAEKRDIALCLLVRNHKKINKFSAEQRNYLLKRIFDDCIFAHKKQKSGSSRKVFDFEQDTDYIYASFMQAYGIDLIEQYDRLHWEKFIALFDGLPEGTKIREVIGIRSRKMPKPTKYNGEEISVLREAKAYYALEVDEAEAEALFQRGIDNLANVLLQKASGSSE